MSWLDKLRELLEASGARVTFDIERDITKPCWCCGRADVPRELVQIGHYLNPLRDSMVRPVCAGCSAQITASDEVEKSATTVDRDGAFMTTLPKNLPVIAGRIGLPCDRNTMPNLWVWVREDEIRHIESNGIGCVITFATPRKTIETADLEVMHCYDQAFDATVDDVLIACEKALHKGPRTNAFARSLRAIGAVFK